MTGLEETKWKRCIWGDLEPGFVPNAKLHHQRDASRQKYMGTNK